MIDQFDFDFSPITPESDDKSLASRFERFHENNPVVYKNLVGLARQFREKRPNAIMGIGMLYEVLRWNYYMGIDTDEDYKLNNDFCAPYARLIMKQEPDLENAFKLRASIID